METIFGLFIIGSLVALIIYILMRNDTQVNQISYQQRTYGRNWRESSQGLMDTITPKVPVRTFTRLPMANANNIMIETPINPTKMPVINCDDSTLQLSVERENFRPSFDLEFTPGLTFKPKKL